MRLAYRDVGKGREQDAEAFLLPVRPPECIAREGNASPAKTGGFVWTVPNSGLTDNRNQSRIGGGILLVTFLLLVAEK